MHGTATAESADYADYADKKGNLARNGKGKSCLSSSAASRLHGGRQKCPTSRLRGRRSASPYPLPQGKKESPLIHRPLAGANALPGE